MLLRVRAPARGKKGKARREGHTRKKTERSTCFFFLAVSLCASSFFQSPALCYLRVWLICCWIMLLLFLDPPLLLSLDYPCPRCQAKSPLSSILSAGLQNVALLAATCNFSRAFDPESSPVLKGALSFPAILPLFGPSLLPGCSIHSPPPRVHSPAWHDPNDPHCCASSLLAATNPTPHGVHRFGCSTTTDCSYMIYVIREKSPPRPPSPP